MTLRLTRRLAAFGPPAVLAACASAPDAALRAAADVSAFDPLPGFPTAPPSPPLGAGPLSTIALASCSNEDRDVSFFDVVAAARPDLLLMLGDNVYGSARPEDPDLPDLRDAYAKMAGQAPFRRLVSAVPTEAIWDDHDFGRNDAGGDFAHKALAQRMFVSFWNIPADAPPRRRPGIYRAFTHGPADRRVQIILLDTRFFRDPLVPTDRREAPGRERYLPHPPSSTADVLGEAQWAWLEGELRKPADIRILASSIQVVAEGHGYERWGNFPAARARLYRLIETTRARGVIFVSGDRHHGSIHRVSEGVARPLVDLTASAINMPSTGEAGTGDHPERGSTFVGRGYAPVNFGLVRLDWAGRAARLELVGATGAPVRELALSFSDLGLA